MQQVRLFLHSTQVTILLLCISIVGNAKESDSKHDPGGLTAADSVTVTTNKSTYFPGEAIEISITYRNNSDTQQTLVSFGCISGYCIDTLKYSPYCSSYGWSCPGWGTNYTVPAHGSVTWSTLDGTFDGLAFTDTLEEGVHFVAGWIGRGFDVSGGEYGTGYTTFSVQNLVGIGSEPEAMPKEFALEQNYPNPFNPVTVIRYSLPVGSPVTLKIFNVLGQTVVTLVDEIQDAGYRLVEWDAGHTPSGVYFYRMVAGSYSETKKLLLTK